MGKRSTFKRVKRDFYPTPVEAVEPLVYFLRDYRTFDEPCCGNGELIRHLEVAGGLKCLRASDIEPQCESGIKMDVFDITNTEADCFITNPPWDRKILHPLIIHLSDIAPTWLLFDADWMHTLQSSELMTRCHKIVSVGRVKWIPGSKMTGKDNCAWYLFENQFYPNTEFHPRRKKEK